MAVCTPGTTLISPCATATTTPATTPTPIPTVSPATFFGLSGADATTWATIVLAVVAALAFVANVYLAIRTSEMTTATKKAAQASEKAAEASEKAAVAAEKQAIEATATVDEIKRDRELAYRPYISWKLTELSVQNEVVTGNPHVAGVNFGRGPALHCLCVAFWPEVMVKARSSLLFDLSPDDEFDVVTEPHVDWPVPGPDVTGQPPSATVPQGYPSARVAFCQDQLGNSYRFVPWKVDADVWRPDDESRPEWLDWYEARRKDLERP
jgi:hypothetical protein